MTISSVEMCQEICHHENMHRFAVKVDIRQAQETVFLFQSDSICINMTPFSYFLQINNCLCIDHDICLSHYNRLSASVCNFKCGGSSDDIYLDDCGGENAYNIYGTQRGILFILCFTVLPLWGARQENFTRTLHHCQLGDILTLIN